MRQGHWRNTNNAAPCFSARLLEQSRTLFQPPLGCFVVGADPFNFAPEPAGVIQVPQMAKLVQNDVVLNERWRLNEPPVQRNRSAPRTGTPTRLLVAHCHPVHL